MTNSHAADLAALLACPRCGTTLIALRCKACRVEFPLHGGVPWLLSDFGNVSAASNMIAFLRSLSVQPMRADDVSINQVNIDSTALIEAGLNNMAVVRILPVKVQGMVDRAREGAEIVVGGERPERAGSYYAPTVIAGPDAQRGFAELNREFERLPASKIITPPPARTSTQAVCPPNSSASVSQTQRHVWPAVGMPTSDTSGLKLSSSMELCLAERRVTTMTPSVP